MMEVLWFWFSLMEMLVYDGWRLCGLRLIVVLWDKMDGVYVVEDDWKLYG